MKKQGTMTDAKRAAANDKPENGQTEKAAKRTAKPTEPDAKFTLGSIATAKRGTVPFFFTNSTKANKKLFYPEVMIPRNLESPISPFIATAHNYKDIGDYQKFEATRRHYKDKYWPVFERAYVHFETGNLRHCRSVRFITRRRN